MHEQIRSTATSASMVSQQLADQVQDALQVRALLESNAAASDKLLFEAKGVIDSLQRENAALKQQLQQTQQQQSRQQDQREPQPHSQHQQHRAHHRSDTDGSAGRAEDAASVGSADDRDSDVDSRARSSVGDKTTARLLEIATADLGAAHGQIAALQGVRCSSDATTIRAAVVFAVVSGPVSAQFCLRLLPQRIEALESQGYSAPPPGHGWQSTRQLELRERINNLEAMLAARDAECRQYKVLCNELRSQLATAEAQCRQASTHQSVVAGSLPLRPSEPPAAGFEIKRASEASHTWYHRRSPSPNARPSSSVDKDPSFEGYRSTVAATGAAKVMMTPAASSAAPKQLFITTPAIDATSVDRYSGVLSNGSDNKYRLGDHPSPNLADLLDCCSPTSQSSSGSNIVDAESFSFAQDGDDDYGVEGDE